MHTMFLSLLCHVQMIKRLCRKLGMPRWPYRQIDSINKAMEDLHDQLQSARTEADRARYVCTKEVYRAWFSLHMCSAQKLPLKSEYFSNFHMFV